jgi:septum formation protein
MKIILASGSPRRYELFSSLGLPFERMQSDMEEDFGTPGDPRDFALKMAQAKAEALSSLRPDSVIIGADTIVVADGEILGKPGTEERALEMLGLLNGKRHRVITGITIIHSDKGVVETGAKITEVEFHRVEEKSIHEYVVSGEPLDKAGAYGIQGKGRFLIKSIEGCYHNVVGLPLCLLVELLRKTGLDGGPLWRKVASDCCYLP